MDWTLESGEADIGGHLSGSTSWTWETETVVHFDRLKRCVPGTRFDSANLLPRTTPVPPPCDPQQPPGTFLELVDDGNTTSTPTEP